MNLKLLNIGIILSILCIYSSLCEELEEVDELGELEEIDEFDELGELSKARGHGKGKEQVKEYMKLIDEMIALSTPQDYKNYNQEFKKPIGGGGVNIMADEMINSGNKNKNNKTQTLKQLLMKPKSHDPCTLFYDCSEKFSYCKRRVQELKDEKYFLLDALQTLQKEKNLYKLRAEILERRLRHCHHHCHHNNYYEDLAANQSIIIARQNQTIRDQASTITNLQSQLSTCTNALANCGGGGSCGTCPTDLTACQSNATTCKNNLNTCSNDLAACRTNATNAVGTIQTVTGERDQCLANLATCQSGTSCTTCLADLSTCRTNATNAVNTITALNNELQACKDNATAAVGTINTCNTDLTACRNNATTAVGTINTCNTDLTACRNNATTAVGTINTCNTDLTACRNNATSTTSQLTTCNSDLIACRNNATTAVGTISSLTSQLNSCINNATQTTTNLKTCTSQLNSCLNNSAITDTLLADCEEDLLTCDTDSAATISDLNSQLSACNTSLSTTRTYCQNSVSGLTIVTSPTLVKYYFQNDLALAETWHGAVEFCRSKGMILATPTISGKQSWLRSKIGTILANEGPSPDGLYWISLNNLDDTGVWVWGGTGAAVTATDWGAFQPEDPNTNNCVGYGFYTSLAKWSDELCSRRARFICEVVEPCNSII